MIVTQIIMNGRKKVSLALLFTLFSLYKTKGTFEDVERQQIKI